MKKLLFLASLLLCQLAAGAQESITASTVEVAPGGEGLLTVGMDFNADHDYVSYQFTVELPEGLSLKPVGTMGMAAYTLADNQPLFPEGPFVVDFPASNGIFKSYSNPSTVITGSQGTLVTIPVVADASLAIGTQLKAKLSGIVFTRINAVAEHFDNVEFNIEVVENITILDENSTTVPTSATDVKVRVLRTVNANEWSTICLPFAMTEEQCKTAFGSDVELGDFAGYKATEDDDKNIITSVRDKKVA